LPELLAPEQQPLLSAHPGQRNVAETMSGFEVIISHPEQLWWALSGPE
jgi:hypothetical protein